MINDLAVQVTGQYLSGSSLVKISVCYLIGQTEENVCVNLHPAIKDRCRTKQFLSFKSFN